MRRLILLFCILMLLVLPGCAVNNSALDNPVKNAPNNLDELPEYEGPGTFERMIADVVVAVPDFIMRFLGLKDINELVFGLNQEPGLAYGLFPNSIWNGVSNLFSIQGLLIPYLLVLALSAWVFLMIFRAGSPMSQMTLRDMTTGFLIFLGSMFFGSYLFQMIFGLNTFMIRIGYAGVSSFFSQLGINDVTEVGFFHALAYVLGMVNLSQLTTLAGSAGGIAGTYFALTTGAAILPYASAGVGIGMAFVLLAAVCFVAVFNFQYVNRMVGIATHIAFFPAVAYASIFPASRRAFDIWLNSILSLTLTQGCQAMFLALFYPAIFTDQDLMSKVILLFILMAALIGIPALVTMILGSPGGPVSSVFGMNAYQGIGRLSKVMRGAGRDWKTPKAPPISNPTSTQSTTNKPTSVGRSKSSFGFMPNMETLTAISKGMKSVGKKALRATPKAMAYAGAGFMAGVGVATMAGAASAVTGNMRAGVGVANMATRGVQRNIGTIGKSFGDPNQSKHLNQSSKKSYDQLSDEALAQYGAGINLMNRQIAPDGTVSSRYTPRKQVEQSTPHINPYTGELMKAYIPKKQRGKGQHANNSAPATTSTLNTSRVQTGQVTIQGTQSPVNPSQFAQAVSGSASDAAQSRQQTSSSKTKKPNPTLNQGTIRPPDQPKK